MSNNISLNEVKNGAFLANQSYKKVVDVVEKNKEEKQMPKSFTNPSNWR